MRISRGKIATAQRIVLMGVEGIGKSTFASMFPDPLFIDTEGSTSDLDVARLPAPESWKTGRKRNWRRKPMNDKTMEQVGEDERKVKALLQAAWKSYHEKMEMLYKCIGIMHGTDADRIAAAYVAGFTDGYKEKESADA